ncbi:hypothetical protein JB92DRAFT_2827515 [Gautieria morchelliformis]|nr:hypothetical protein JB92DRAFT_2827515 [Gautieria morchelliformis]
MTCYLAGQGWLRGVAYFGEQGWAVILNMLEALFPPGTPLPNSILPMSHEVVRKDHCHRLEACLIVLDGSLWGAIHLPLASGTAGEDIDVEYKVMVQAAWTGRDKKGKPQKVQVKEEENHTMELTIPLSIEKN